MTETIQTKIYTLTIKDSWDYLEFRDLYNGTCSQEKCNRPSISRTGEVTILCESHYQELRQYDLKQSRFEIILENFLMDGLKKACEKIATSINHTHEEKVIATLKNAHLFGMPGLTSMEVHQVLGMGIEQIRKRTSGLKKKDILVVVGWRSEKFDEVLAVKEKIPSKYFGNVRITSSLYPNGQMICEGCERPQINPNERSKILDLMNRVADQLRGNINPSSNDISKIMDVTYPTLVRLKDKTDKIQNTNPFKNEHRIFSL